MQNEAICTLIEIRSPFFRELQRPFFQRVEAQPRFSIETPG